MTEGGKCMEWQRVFISASSSTRRLTRQSNTQSHSLETVGKHQNPIINILCQSELHTRESGMPRNDTGKSDLQRQGRSYTNTLVMSCPTGVSPRKPAPSVTCKKKLMGSLIAMLNRSVTVTGDRYLSRVVPGFLTLMPVSCRSVSCMESVTSGRTTHSEFFYTNSKHKSLSHRAV